METKEHRLTAYDIKDLRTDAWMHYEVVRRPQGKYVLRKDAESVIRKLENRCRELMRDAKAKS